MHMMEKKFLILTGLIVIFSLFSCKKDHKVEPISPPHNQNNPPTDTTIYPLKRADISNAKYLYIKKSSGKTLSEYGYLHKIDQQNLVSLVSFYNTQNQRLDSVKVKFCIKFDENYLSIGIIESNNVEKRYLLEINTGNLYQGGAILPDIEGTIVQKDDYGNYYYGNLYGPNGTRIGNLYGIIKLNIQNFSASVVSMQGDDMCEPNDFIVNKFGDIIYRLSCTPGAYPVMNRYRNATNGQFKNLPMGCFAQDINRDTMYFFTSYFEEMYKIYPNQSTTKIDTISINTNLGFGGQTLWTYSGNRTVGFTNLIISSSGNNVHYYEINTITGEVSLLNTIPINANFNNIITYKITADGKVYLLTGGISDPFELTLIDSKNNYINTFFSSINYNFSDFQIVEGGVICKAQDLNDGLQKILFIKLDGQVEILEQGSFQIEYLIKV